VCKVKFGGRTAGRGSLNLNDSRLAERQKQTVADKRQEPLELDVVIIAIICTVRATCFMLLYYRRWYNDRDVRALCSLHCRPIMSDVVLTYGH